MNIASFQSEIFKAYLVKHLRGTSDTSGVFKLVKATTPLTDSSWEELQYACIQIIPLSNEQLQALQAIYDFLSKAGIHGLKPHRNRNVITNQVKNRNFSRNLNKLFTRLNARWYLRFFPSAFGLEYIYFHLQLKESVNLRELLNFHHPANTVLNRSNVFQIKEFQNNYLGTFVVPSLHADRLHSYLEQYEHHGQLILHDYEVITDFRRSSSLNLYKTAEGWLSLKQKELDKLTSQLRMNELRRRSSKIKSFFMSPQYNHQWNYRQHPSQINVMTLYCSVPDDFSFQELPLTSSNDKPKYIIPKSEKRLLKELFDRRVVYVDFVPIRLMYEFSPETYWIIMPPISLKQLSYLLQWLPYSELYFTEKYTHMRTTLTPKLVDWMKNDLNWTILPILREYYPNHRTLDWYDPDKLHWATPAILNT
ncbi:MAG: hypothetical protein ACFFDT_33445 [Candidatus Hodarchaeota archaeon]